MLECAITAKGEAQTARLFEAEEKEFKHKRSEYEVSTKGDDLIITIRAQDPTALRASVTSVTRILNIARGVRG